MAALPTTTAWSTPGPATHDFRSDVVTTPTASMLSAIAETTLGDDVFHEDATTANLEAHIADLTGHEAGLLVMSGTMGNQIALRTHLGGPPHSVLCDARSHVLCYEAGGAASLCGALVVGVEPKNGMWLTLEEIRDKAVLDGDVHGCPTRVVSLENTLNGVPMPLGETRRIVEWARGEGIVCHLDGARVWEAAVAGAGSLRELCGGFDSVSLCFSKGLGAPIGSVLVGRREFIAKARWVRKMLGGGLRQAGVIAAPMMVAVQETFVGGKLKASHEMAKRVEKLWVSLGGRVKLPVETNIVWLDLEACGWDYPRFIELAKKHGVKISGARLVVHYQISDEGVKALEGIMKEMLLGETA
ncbi:threonine aldolase [Trichodelitschia bisporula]|uniref:Threonine aldolase n=1 Tax=Trichodelitschia bisporula TaxID=703511 RepID=A0A6G1HWK7_9PEZI|nr:threonine aldolase [Trichodelitschia bisporula]